MALLASAEAVSKSRPNCNELDWLYSSSVADAEALLDRSDLGGVQALYSWRSLEPEEDKYDFSQIENDLTLVHSKGKELWVQLQDRSFNKLNDPVPSYLHQDLYNNGSVPQCDGDKCETDFQVEGWAAVQWNQHVRDRFQLLVQHLAKSFDGRIYGMNFPETSIEVNETDNGFTSYDYFNGTLENALAARKAFNHSYIVQYVNFWPDGWANENGYMNDSFKFFANHNIGAGGPDNIPFHPAQEHNSYPYMDEYRHKLPISVIAVQEPDLLAINNATGKNFTRAEFTDFAVNDLGCDIIFWTTKAPWLNESE